MEVFSLFKHRRGGGVPPPSAAPPTIATSALRPSTDTEDDGGVGDDEGPFFDLEFAVPEDDDRESHVSGSEPEDYDLTAFSDRSFCGGANSSRAAGSDACSHSPSPSEDLFFKGSTSLLFATSEPRSKPSSNPKSSTKLRVMMLGFKKPKETAAEHGAAAAAAASPKHRRQSKFFVKFKVEEVPIVSLFTSSGRNTGSSVGGKSAKLHPDGGAATSAPEKRPGASKDALQRYLSKIKPLYVRVSKRYGEKLGFSGQLGSPDVGGAETPPPAAAGVNGKSHRTQGGGGGSNLQAGLRVVCRRLGKSRSASAAVRSPPARRRDDTLLELQDGIQSAIAHCKRSFNEGRGGSAESTPLVRSRSDPGEERH